MGEYTAFNMKCELKKDTPRQVIETLEFMLNPDKTYSEAVCETPPSHVFFETECWEDILDGSIDNDEDSGMWVLNIVSSVKDHENQVVSFLHWLAPYSNTEGFVGTTHPAYENEESRILFQRGHAFLVCPVENFGCFNKPEEVWNHVEESANFISAISNIDANSWEKLNDPVYASSLKRQLENVRRDNPYFEEIFSENRRKQFKKIVDKLYGKTSDEGETPPE